MTTIRAYLQRQKRRRYAVSLAGFALFALGAILSQLNQILFVVAFAGMAMIVAGMLLTWAIRCPRCGQCLGQMLVSAPWSWAWTVSASMKFCPFCGVELDSELIERGSPS